MHREEVVTSATVMCFSSISFQAFWCQWRTRTQSSLHLIYLTLRSTYRTCIHVVLMLWCDLHAVCQLVSSLSSLWLSLHHLSFIFYAVLFCLMSLPVHSNSSHFFCLMLFSLVTSILFYALLSSTLSSSSFLCYPLIHSISRHLCDPVLHSLSLLLC